MEVLGNAGIVYVLWNHCPNVPGAGRKAQYTAYPCGIFRSGGGQEAVIGLDGTVLEGKLPKSQMKLVDAWMEIHKDDLAANWTLLSNGEQFFRIDPLK